MNILFFLAKDDNLRKIIKEIEYLSEDYSKLQQIGEIAIGLRYYIYFCFNYTSNINYQLLTGAIISH